MVWYARLHGMFDGCMELIVCSVCLVLMECSVCMVYTVLLSMPPMDSEDAMHGPGTVWTTWYNIPHRSSVDRGRVVSFFSGVCYGARRCTIF